MHIVLGTGSVGIKVGVTICLRSGWGTVGSVTDSYIGQANELHVLGFW